MRPHLALLLAVLALPSVALAHRLDEYLQATLVTIEPNRVRLQINLTPGVAVADKVLARIDRDRDGQISTGEAAAYASLVQRQLTVVLDRHQLALKLSTSNFPPPSKLRTGWAIIQLDFATSIEPLAPGPHKLTVKNRHLPSFSVYLLNAARPDSSRVQITGQTRNKHQSTGSIQFLIARPDNSSRARQGFRAS